MPDGRWKRENASLLAFQHCFHETRQNERNHVTRAIMPQTCTVEQKHWTSRSGLYSSVILRYRYFLPFSFWTFRSGLYSRRFCSFQFTPTRSTTFPQHTMSQHNVSECLATLKVSVEDLEACGTLQLEFAVIKRAYFKVSMHQVFVTLE